MRITVALPFVRGCPECTALAEGAAVAAIRDVSVTSFTLTPGKQHAHATKPTDAATDKKDEAGIQLFELLPVSDTNGFDSSMLPNGFDTEGR